MNPLPPSASVSDLVTFANALLASTTLPTSNITVTTSIYTYGATTPQNAVLLVNTSNQKIIQIPDSTPVGTKITVKDVSGTASINMIVIQPFGNITIDGSTSSVFVNVNWGSVDLFVTAGGIYTKDRFMLQSPYMDSLIQFAQSIGSSVEIGGGTNALSVGPVTIANSDINGNNVVVTVDDGARWVII